MLNCYRRMGRLNLAGLSVIGVLFGIFHLLHPRPDPSVIAIQGTTGYKFSRPQQELFDFSLEERVAGEVVFTLKGKNFAIQKKKVGLFRFGLMQEPVIEHAIFNLICMNKMSSHPGEQQPVVGNDIAKELGTIFSDQSLSGLLCKPISLTVRAGGQDGYGAQIIADFAAFAHGVISFQGNVRLISARSRLETTKLELDLRDNRITTQQGYAIITEQGRREGHGLASDLFLNALPAKQ